MFTRFLVLMTLLGGAALALPTGAASAAARTPIGPGVQMVTGSTLCAANFVFRDRTGRLLVGYAARCAAPGATAATNGCTARTRPLGTRVRFATGATATSAGRTLGWGTLRYSSWTAMRRAHASSAELCATNDFALVEVSRASRRRVDPSVPYWGGPTGLGPVAAAGSRVYSTGRLSGDTSVSPRSGTVSSATSRLGLVSVPLPSGARDTGSGFLDADGRAFGLLSGRQSGNDAVTGLAGAVAFARHHGVRGLHLVRGREAFSQSAVY